MKQGGGFSGTRVRLDHHDSTVGFGVYDPLLFASSSADSLVLLTVVTFEPFGELRPNDGLKRVLETLSPVFDVFVLVKRTLVPEDTTRVYYWSGN
jgi:hypothetical protein